MSRFASVPMRPGDMRRPQNSVEPNASMTFGQVFVAVQRSSRLAAGASARRVGVARPTRHGLAARLVERRRAAGQREAEIHRRLPRGDARKHAVPDDPAVQVLVEAEMNERLDEVARLRVADRDRVLDRAGDRIGRAAPRPPPRGGRTRRCRAWRRGRCRARADPSRCRRARRAALGSNPSFRQSRVGSGVPGNGMRAAVGKRPVAARHGRRRRSSRRVALSTADDRQRRAFG